MRLHRALVAVSALALTTNAWWRMECQGVVGVARVDPLVSFGKASQHAHAVSGSGAFSMTASYDELVAGNCTSCRAKQDKSAYWHPAIYFKDAATGKYELVQQIAGTLVYYMMHGDNIVPFPKGFRMIAGENSRRNYTLGDPWHDPAQNTWAALGQTDQKSLRQRAVGFNCLNYNSGKAEGSLTRHEMPPKDFIDANCPNGIRFELMFPSCWNGKDVTSDNYQDHVAYPDAVNSGSCPPGFPVRLPSMMFEVIWQVALFPGRDGQFVIANGNTDGYAYHGDFVMGWEGDTLERAMRVCGDPYDDGQMDHCSVFDLQQQSDWLACKMPLPAELASENTSGPLDQLPGNVPVGGLIGNNGGQNPPQAPNPPPVPSPPQVPAESARPSSTAVAVPDQVLQGQKSSAPAAPPAVTAPVPEAPAPTRLPGYSYTVVSTEYKTVGNMVTEVIWEQAIQYVTEEVVSTATVMMGGHAPVKARQAHVHRHAAHHGGRF